MHSGDPRRFLQTGVSLAGLLAAWPADAYFGPGAAIGLVGYFFGMVAILGVAVLMVISYPLYWVRRKLGARRARVATKPGDDVQGSAS
jgi:hypothetical protein